MNQAPPGAALQGASLAAEERPAARATFGESRRHVTLPRSAVLLAAIGAQAIFARVLYLQPTLAAAQAAALIGLTLWGTIKRNPQLLLQLAAYLTGAEITWRQSRSPVPYQIGPYLTIAIATLALITVYPSINRLGRRALLYFALLVPSSIITISATAGNARQLLAFSLAGPLALAALTIWLSQVLVAPWFYRRMLWTIAVSGVGPLTIAATNLNDYLGTGEKLTFSDASNFVASGGFGPVQVSSVLGLTVLVAVLLVVVETTTVTRVIAGAVGLAAGTQSLLTFSRGGMFATAFAVAGLALAQAGDREGRRRVLTVIAVVFTIGYFVIIPRLDNFTQGAFNERFTDTKSGRTDLATSDVEVFKEHPLFGVGPGMTKYQRLSYDICRLRNDACKDEASSHTEFTRMLSEHGTAGLAAIGMLASLAVAAVLRAGKNRYLAVTFIVWAIAQMFYANIRVVAVAFAFAFAFIQVRSDDEVSEDDDVIDDDPDLSPSMT